MAARVDHLLPGNWAAAGLPKLTPAQASQVSDAVSVGVAPLRPGTPPQVAGLITKVAHETFISGMTLSFTVAAVVAAVAALVATQAKRGANADAAGGSVHI